MLIKVKTFPNSKINEIQRKSEDSFEIKIKEKPKEGRANKAVIAIISSFFGVPRGKVRMIKGARERNKIFEIKI